MADTPATPPPPSPEPPASQSSTDFRIGEEFGTAKRNLPPARIVLICVAAVAVILGVVAYLQRAQPQGSGSIDGVNAVDVPGQSQILVAVTVTLRNVGEKALWIHTLKAGVTTADQKSYEDTAASAVDFDRYYEAFPPLKINTQPALYPEAKIVPGAQQSGTIIVSFPVSKEAFDQRKSLTVTIQPYDQPLPVILTK